MNILPKKQSKKPSGKKDVASPEKGSPSVKDAKDSEEKLAKVVENEKVALKNLTKRLLQEVESLQNTSEMGKLAANSVLDYAKLFDDGSLFAEDLRESWCLYCKHNILGPLGLSAGYLKPMGDEEVQRLLLERVRSQTVEDVVSFLISYQLFLTESAKTFGEHLPSLRGLKDEAIQRKMAVEKELSEKIDLSQPQKSLKPRALSKETRRFSAPSMKSKKDKADHDAKVEAALEKVREQQKNDSAKGGDPKILPSSIAIPSTSSPTASPGPLTPVSTRDYSIPPARPYFGVDLSVLMQQQAESSDPWLKSLKVPVFLFETVRALEASGLNQVGLFRIAGDKKRVKEIRTGLDYEDLPLREGMFVGEKEHTLCSLIKLFLRELPNALFGFDSVDRWFEIAWMDEGLQFVKAVQPTLYAKMVQGLPAANATTLQFLVAFLARIAAKSEENKMDSTNLASLIAPNTLYRKEPRPDTMADDTAASNWILDMLIYYHTSLFNTTAIQKPGEAIASPFPPLPSLPTEETKPTSSSSAVAPEIPANPSEAPMAQSSPKVDAEVAPAPVDDVEVQLRLSKAAPYIRAACDYLQSKAISKADIAAAVPADQLVPLKALVDASESYADSPAVTVEKSFALLIASLKSLADSVIPQSKVEKLLKENESERTAAIKAQVDTMPIGNVTTLGLLCKTIQALVGNGTLSAVQLIEVFAPQLLGPLAESTSAERGKSIELLEFIVENYRSLTQLKESGRRQSRRIEGKPSSSSTMSPKKSKRSEKSSDKPEKDKEKAEKKRTAKTLSPTDDAGKDKEEKKEERKDKSGERRERKSHVKMSLISVGSDAAPAASVASTESGIDTQEKEKEKEGDKETVKSTASTEQATPKKEKPVEPKAADSPVSPRSAFSSRFGGGLSCARCEKTIYLNERQEYKGKQYHDRCAQLVIKEDEANEKQLRLEKEKEILQKREEEERVQKEKEEKEKIPQKPVSAIKQDFLSVYPVSLTSTSSPAILSPRSSSSTASQASGEKKEVEKKMSAPKIAPSIVVVEEEEQRIILPPRPVKQTDPAPRFASLKMEMHEEVEHHIPVAENEATMDMLAFHKRLLLFQKLSQASGLTAESVGARKPTKPLPQIEATSDVDSDDEEDAASLAAKRSIANLEREIREITKKLNELVDQKRAMQEGLSSNKVAGSPTMTRATSGGPSSSGPEPRVTSHSTPGIPPSAEPQTPGFGRGRGRGGPRLSDSSTDHLPDFPKAAVNRSSFEFWAKFSDATEQNKDHLGKEKEKSEPRHPSITVHHQEEVHLSSSSSSPIASAPAAHQVADAHE